MPSPSQSLTDVIRAAGGIVHGDGNIFFTSHAQFQSAVEALSRPTPPEAQAGAGMEAIAFALRFPHDARLNLSTVFDTEAEAVEYAERCSPDVVVVPMYESPAAPKAVAQGWRPITDADKDGSSFLVNDTTGLYAPYCMAKWLQGEEWSGWIYDDEACNDSNPLGPQPTHCMRIAPIAAAPTAGETL